MPPEERRHLIRLTVLLIIIVFFIGTTLLFYFRSSVPRGFVAPPVRDRVRNVVLLWSRAPSISDTDQLETIWAQTRKSGNHDYDYSPGGVYDLNRLLTLEFTKPPTKIVPSFVSFGASGKIKTFADLVDAMQQ
jgi:hypothetical protein